MKERRIVNAYPRAMATIDPDVEVRLDSDGRTLEGYMLVFDRWSENLGGFREKISSAAKVELDDDVIGTFNHDRSQLLGRTSSRTMELQRDKRGLRYSIALPDTTVGRDVRELVRRGDVKGSSFTFEVLADTWANTKDGQERTLEAIKVYEGGPVALPAYPDTTAAVRAMSEHGQGPPAARVDRRATAEARQRAAENLVDLLDD